MATKRPALAPSPFDLTAPPPLRASSEVLIRRRVSDQDLAEVEAVAQDPEPRERSRKLAEVLRKVETVEAVDLLQAAGQGCLRLQESAIAFLFGFLEVKRPGVEVLRQIQPLASVERVSLRILAGTWAEPEESPDSVSLDAVTNLFEEGVRVGLLSEDAARFPDRPGPLRHRVAAIRTWFAEIATLLEHGGELAEPVLHYLTQAAMTEINLLERRVSILAGSIDPYDVRGMARLLPVVSRVDQDIAHMKTVVSRITTYAPFRERLLTMEHTLSSHEMDKLVRKLYGAEATEGLGHLVVGMRRHPILDRTFAQAVSILHQVAGLRAAAVGQPGPDLLSSMLGTILAFREGAGISLRLEPETVDSIWETLASWGGTRPDQATVRLPVTGDRAPEFVTPGGLPRLPDRPATERRPELTFKQMVRSQLQNDVFILGILDNGKAIQHPGVVEMIAGESRSLRVLDKICNVSALHTGPVNGRVPARILANPSRIPLTYLRRFINVRYLSKMDLARMTRAKGMLRPEVRKEIEAYLASIQT